MQAIVTSKGIYLSVQSRGKMRKPAKSLEALLRSALADKTVAGGAATPPGEQLGGVALQEENE